MVFQNTVFQNTVFQKRPFNSGLKYDHSLRTVILNQNPTRHAHEIHTAPAPSNLDQVLLGWKDGRSTKPLYPLASSASASQFHLNEHDGGRALATMFRDCR